MSTRLRFPSIDLLPGTVAFYLAALLMLLVGYGFALSMTFGIGFGRALLNGMVPVTGVAVMGILARVLILHGLFRLAPARQAAAHAAAAFAFAILLYWLRTILNGVVLTGDAFNLRLPDFFAPGAAWMTVEGMLIYALIALAAYIEVLRARLAVQPASQADETEGKAERRIFVRQDDEFRPVDPARIILVRGADDYAELVTASGTHLVRMTLTALEDRLGPRFIRVHRSCLVNVERIGKAEPAGGGRMLIHMDNGAMITSSRAGARLLRERIV